MTELTFHWVDWVANALSNHKVLFEKSLGFSDDVVHVFAGFFLQLASAILLRISIASWRPIMVVALAEMLNEVMDVTRDVWPSPSMQLGESLKDIILTLALPILLLLLSRCWPQVFVSKGSNDAAVAPTITSRKRRAP